MRKHVFLPVAVAILPLGFGACQSQVPAPQAPASVAAVSTTASSQVAVSSTISSNESASLDASSRSSIGIPSSGKSSSGLTWLPSSHASKASRIVPAFSEQNDVWRGNFPLTAVGKNALPDFLPKAGLTDIANLKIIGGTNLLTSDVCKKLFSKYQVIAKVKVDTSRCTTNLLSDSTFADGDPLVINLSEFDSKYLLLMIDEEGLGQPKMFSYAYSIPTGEFSIIHREKAGDTYTYYGDSVLYFTTPQGKLTYTYDLETRQLTKK